MKAFTMQPNQAWAELYSKLMGGPLAGRPAPKGATSTGVLEGCGQLEKGRKWNASTRLHRGEKGKAAHGATHAARRFWM